MGLLGRADIIRGWTQLGELAAAEGQTVELLVVGGAVMAVHFRSREATEDVDAVFVPTAKTRIWAHRVAALNEWPDDWLNDAVKGYLAKASTGPLLHESPGIRAHAAAFEQLLAMKLMAWRDDIDVEDARRLLRELRCADLDELRATVAPFVLESHALRAQYALEELWTLTRQDDESGTHRTHDPR